VIGARDRTANPLIRGGLALGAAAGVLVAIAPAGDLVSGPARGAADTTATIDLDGAVSALGAVGAVLLVVAAALPWLWAHLAGLALTPLVGITAGLIVLAGRASDDFAAEADLSLERGGVLLVLAFWVSIAAIVLILVGIRQVAMAIPPRRAGEGEDPEAAEPPRRSSGKATVSVVLAIAGFLGAFAAALAFAAPLAIAFGTLALGDIRSWGGALKGRGVALAGVGLGIVALSLLIALIGSSLFLLSPD
jgi:hypothetical protein